MGRHFGYYIDSNERGAFLADVRDTDGTTVFEIRAGNSLADDESSVFDDGYMRDGNDLPGLTEHLRRLGVIPCDADVLPAGEFERLAEMQQGDLPAPGQG